MFDPDLWPTEPKIVCARPAEPLCARCGKTPTFLGYGDFCEGEQTPDEYVVSNEGTYDPGTGKFLCDGCYIAVGMPSGPRGWTATPENLRVLIPYQSVKDSELLWNQNP